MLFLLLLFLLLLLTLVTLFPVRRYFYSSLISPGNTCLILGPVNSGKTALFFKLQDKSSDLKQTHTSMKENEAKIVISGEGSQKDRAVHLVDIPGHERVRSRYQHYLPVTSCIIFMIDTIDFSSNVTQVGEYIFDLLTNSHVVKRKIPILVVCNKSDISVHNKEFVKKELAAELNKIRATRTSQMHMAGQTDDLSNNTTVDLVEDVQRAFSFEPESLRTRVEFVDFSLKNNKDLSKIENFIASCLQ
jgi:signal recognition particle receptor subunit beta